MKTVDFTFELFELPCIIKNGPIKSGNYVFKKFANLGLRSMIVNQVKFETIHPNS